MKLPKCNDCDHPDFVSLYHFGMHRGFKHDDWSGLYAYYESIGLPPEVWVRGRVKLDTLIERAKQIGKYRVYERRWKCASCEAPKIYDPIKKTVSCECGTVTRYSITPELLVTCFRPILIGFDL